MIAEMTFEERNTWIFAVTAILSYAAYLAVILGRAQGTPLAQVAYVRPMLWAIGVAIVASIAGSILSGVVWRRDCAKKDVRDEEIRRFGEYVGNSFVAIGAMAALFLSMAEVAHFWIANAVYLCFALSALLASATKIIAYRTGFQSC
jgi:hypothetical protein